MKLIAWDTSSKIGALAAMEGEGPNVRLVTELALNVDLTHSERLLWGIHQLLEAAHWKIQEVDVLGVGVGPGSFTGLRVGLTTARTLAHTLKKPLIGVSSLAALARPVAIHFSQKEWINPTWVIAATDACKGELFALYGLAPSVMSFSGSSSGMTLPAAGAEVFESVIKPGKLIDDLLEKLTAKNAGNNRWIVVGEGKQRYADEWARLPSSQMLAYSFPYSDQIQGRYVGLLVWEALQAGKIQEALQVHPRYLRASDAEIKLKAGLLPPAPQE